MHSFSRPSTALLATCLVLLLLLLVVAQQASAVRSGVSVGLQKRGSSRTAYEARRARFHSELHKTFTQVSQGPTYTQVPQGPTRRRILEDPQEPQAQDQPQKQQPQEIQPSEIPQQKPTPDQQAALDHAREQAEGWANKAKEIEQHWRDEANKAKNSAGSDAPQSDAPSDDAGSSETPQTGENLAAEPESNDDGQQQIPSEVQQALDHAREEAGHWGQQVKDMEDQLRNQLPSAQPNDDDAASNNVGGQQLAQGAPWDHWTDQGEAQANKYGGDAAGAGGDWQHWADQGKDQASKYGGGAAGAGGDWQHWADQGKDQAGKYGGDAAAAGGDWQHWADQGKAQAGKYAGGAGFAAKPDQDAGEAPWQHWIDQGKAQAGAGQGGGDAPWQHWIDQGKAQAGGDQAGGGQGGSDAPWQHWIDQGKAQAGPYSQPPPVDSDGKPTNPDADKWKATAEQIRDRWSKMGQGYADKYKNANAPNQPNEPNQPNAGGQNFAEQPSAQPQPATEGSPQIPEDIRSIIEKAKEAAKRKRSGQPAPSSDGSSSSTSSPAAAGPASSEPRHKGKSPPSQEEIEHWVDQILGRDQRPAHPAPTDPPSDDWRRLLEDEDLRAASHQEWKELAQSTGASVPYDGSSFASYYAQLTIEDDDFWVVMDTGSSTTAIATGPASGCYKYFHGECHGQATSASYGSGNWTGHVCHAQVSIGGLSAGPKFGFAAMEHQEGMLDCAGPPSHVQTGIAGMGFPTLLKDNSTQDLATEVVRHSGIANMFSMQCCGWRDPAPAGKALENPTPWAEGHLDWGEIVPEHHHGEVRYTPIIHESYYVVDMIDIAVKSTTPGHESDSPISIMPQYQDRMHPAAPLKPPTIVDSGTGALDLTPAIFNNLVELLQQHLPYRLPKAFWTGDMCLPIFYLQQHWPEIHVTLAPMHGEEPFTLVVPPEAYLGRTPESSCGQGSFGRMFFVNEFPTTNILGQTLMESYYVVFDNENRRVGFAPIAGCEPDPSIYDKRSSDVPDINDYPVQTPERRPSGSEEHPQPDMRVNDAQQQDQVQSAANVRAQQKAEAAADVAAAAHAAALARAQSSGWSSLFVMLLIVAVVAGAVVYYRSKTSATQAGYTAIATADGYYAV